MELGTLQANSGVSWHRCHQGHRLFLPFSSSNFDFLATLLTFHLRATEAPSAPGPLIGKKGGIFLDKSIFFFREENVIYKQSQHHPLRLFHLPPASRLILGLLAWADHRVAFQYKGGLENEHQTFLTSVTEDGLCQQERERGKPLARQLAVPKQVPRTPKKGHKSIWINTY